MLCTTSDILSLLAWSGNLLQSPLPRHTHTSVSEEGISTCVTDQDEWSGSYLVLVSTPGANPESKDGHYSRGGFGRDYSVETNKQR